MKYTGPRLGTFATYRGREYESAPIFPDGNVMIGAKTPDNPDPALFQWNDGWDAWTAMVPAAEIDRLYHAIAYAKYQGHRVSINSVDESGAAHIAYADDNGAWAGENGFTQVNKYEYEKTVSAYELYDVYEKQNDELFWRWRAASFAQPVGNKR